MESNESPSARHDLYVSASLSNKKSRQYGLINQNPTPISIGPSASLHEGRVQGPKSLSREAGNLRIFLFDLTCGKHPQVKFVKRPDPPFVLRYRRDRQPRPSTRWPNRCKSPSFSSHFASTPPSRPRAPRARSSSPRTTSLSPQMLETYSRSPPGRPQPHVQMQIVLRMVEGRGTITPCHPDRR